MIGHAYKWAAEDFTYVGLVTEAANGLITMMTKIGEITFPEDDGSLTPAPMVKLDLDVYAANAKKRVAAAPKAPSKKKLSAKQQQAVDVIKAYMDEHDALPTRPVGMQLLKDQLGFGDGTASTYFARAKQELS